MTIRLPIDYVEFASPDLAEMQDFCARAFGWDFVDYGPDYRDIQGAGIGGGLERGAAKPPLIVLLAADLAAAYEQVRAAGANITAEIYSFPGGRRFEFTAPDGTAMAVWAKD
jgi:predicted enzyme related to lactoylglutathione lyase